MLYGCAGSSVIAAGPREQAGFTRQSVFALDHQSRQLVE